MSLLAKVFTGLFAVSEDLGEYHGPPLPPETLGFRRIEGATAEPDYPPSTCCVRVVRLVQQRRRELADTDDAPFVAEADQQPQLRLGAAVFASKRALVCDESVNDVLDALAVAHESTSSPSPSATWRNCSTATFV